MNVEDKGFERKFERKEERIFITTTIKESVDCTDFFTIVDKIKSEIEAKERNLEEFRADLKRYEEGLPIANELEKIRQTKIDEFVKKNPVEKTESPVCFSESKTPEFEIDKPVDE